MDNVLALYSVPVHLPERTRETLQQVLMEMVRVLRDTGSAHIYPIAQQDLQLIQEILQGIPEIETQFSLVPENPADRVYRDQEVYRLTITKRPPKAN